MEDQTRKAADICDAVGAFFSDSDFIKKLENKNMFSMASMMLRDYPTECMNLIRAYDGKPTDSVQAVEIYERIMNAVKGTTEVFQRFG